MKPGFGLKFLIANWIVSKFLTPSEIGIGSFGLDRAVP